MAKKKDESTTRQSNVAKVVRAMMKAEDSKFWVPMFGWLGLDDDETVERMTRILVVHLLLDRALTALIAVSLLNPRVMPSYKSIEEALAPVSVNQRIELAKAAHLISASCASTIKTVNRVRNKLAHHYPKLGFGVAHVQEISSQKAFQRCVETGMSALREVIQAIVQSGVEVFPKL